MVTKLRRRGRRERGRGFIAGHVGHRALEATVPLAQEGEDVVLSQAGAEARVGSDDDVGSAVLVEVRRRDRLQPVPGRKLSRIAALKPVPKLVDSTAMPPVDMLLSELATTTSGKPSPLKSPTARATGLMTPVSKLPAVVNRPVAVAKIRRDAARRVVIGNDEIKVAVVVEIDGGERRRIDVLGGEHLEVGAECPVAAPQQHRDAAIGRRPGGLVVADRHVEIAVIVEVRRPRPVSVAHPR